MGNGETGPLRILPFLYNEINTGRKLQNQSPKGISQQKEGRSVSGGNNLYAALVRILGGWRIVEEARSSTSEFWNIKPQDRPFPILR